MVGWDVEPAAPPRTSSQPMQAKGGAGGAGWPVDLLTKLNILIF